MTFDGLDSPGRLLERDGEAVALLIRCGDHWEFHALDHRWAHLEGRCFGSAVAAEHALVLDRRDRHVDAALFDPA